MEKQEDFGKYIREKRKERGFSQKQLAEMLFISESAVSKWERGLSYPDITLVTSLCKALDISEHELLTASDDIHQREIEAQSRGYLKILRTYSWVSYLIYVIILVPVFIWSARNPGEWPTFFYTLTTLGIVFSLINIPVLTKKYRPQKMFVGAYVCLILLLTALRFGIEADGQHWSIMSVLGVSLAMLGIFLPLILRSLRIVSGRTKALISAAVDTVLFGLLMYFGYTYYSGYGYLTLLQMMILTIIILATAWIMILACLVLPVRIWSKIFICIAILGCFVLFAVPYLNYFIQEGLGSAGSFGIAGWASNWNEYGSGTLAIVLFAIAGAGILIGKIRKYRR